MRTVSLALVPIVCCVIGCGAIDALDDPDAIEVASSTFHERIDAIGPTARAVVADPIPGQWALIRDDAALLEGDATVGRAGTPGDAEVGGVLHVTVLGYDPATQRVRIERNDVRSAPCWWDDTPFPATSGFDGMYRWQAEVAIESVVPVVRTALSIEFDDHTRITVGEGVPAVAGDPWGQREWAVSRGLDWGQQPIAVPTSHLGHSYAPRDAPSYPGGRGGLVEPTLDGQPWVGIGPWGWATGIEPEESTGFALVGDDCIRARVQVEDVSWNLPGVCGGGRGWGTGTLQIWTVREGAEATWPDGSAAGVTLRELDLTTAPVARDDRWCFELPMHGGPAPTGHVTVCHADADVSPPTWPNHATISVGDLTIEPAPVDPE